MSYVILAEKPSAAKNMARAFGGMNGTYKGQKYRIVSLLGHIMEFVEPHEMVSDELVEEFKAWEPTTMPWDTSQMSWKKQPQKTRNPRTGRMGSKASVLKEVKEALKGASAVVIATDKDPSGEGQLIGWAVIQAVGWKGDVKRLYFNDESDKELQGGFDNLVDLPNVDNIYKDGEFAKADVRSKWDFISMQLTRLSTHAARTQGYNTVVRQGRLKSVMIKLVADQLALIKAYVKKPYYEARYKDDNGNVYRRKFDAEVDTWRFVDKNDAESDAKQYGTSDIVQDSKNRRQTSPGKLLDLGGLASILTGRGYKSREILSTYQKMYEATIVSYPRTEDKVISSEQFNEMLPLVDRIADVVGADKSLLTHRKPRKTHVKEGGAHGANRPGLTVPKSLDSLNRFGPSAKAIYEILAKNFLAMFGENYTYDSIKAHVKDHPSFTATINIPVDQGFRAIFDADSETKVEEDEDTDEKDSTGVGSKGEPFIAEGVNRKPPNPTHKWLERQLGRYDVGTGATRVGTLSDVTAGKYALLTDTRGRLALTQTGEIMAVLLEGSRIGDPKVTETLFKSMNDVGELKLDPATVLKTATDVVEHDKRIYYQNAQKLHKVVGKPKDSERIKPRAAGIYKPTNQPVAFNKEWAGYEFTDEDVERLLNGDTIAIQAVGRDKKTYRVEGSLGESEYKGNKFWGFQRKRAEDYTIKDAPFPKSWSRYTFTKEDEAKLRNGDKINIEAISGKGNPYNVDITFEMTEYNGSKGWRIKPHFEEFKDASEYTSYTAPFPKSWSQYTFTEEDELKLRDGKTLNIEATSRAGKPFTVNVTFEITEYKGNKGWRIKPHFENSGTSGKDAKTYTRKDAPFNKTFAQYTLTDEEVEHLRNGERVMVTGKSKAGKPFTCAVSLELKEYKGRTFWGLDAHFD